MDTAENGTVSPPSQESARSSIRPTIRVETICNTCGTRAGYPVESDARAGLQAHEFQTMHDDQMLSTPASNNTTHGHSKLEQEATVMTAPTNVSASHNPQGEFQHTIEQSELDAQAARFRTVGMTYRDIAAQMSCDVSTAHARVKRALAAVPVEAVTELRLVELERLDDLVRRFMTIAGGTFPLVSNGRLMLDPSTGKPMRDLAPNLHAMRELRLVSESRRRLLGLDAPARLQVEVQDAVTAEIERLAAELGVQTEAIAPIRTISR